ncbi:hypothetical protein QET40_06700 [Akkermansia sp. N21169]|uniref:hypothetical protein n=1 Tax=Akkermansia sp. N21169 TaxID=3040765 RepID=UPI00244EF764|nr:hypothetical protein [Akkermansia sp. N21169]MDH3068803.1 hypothetical protein [Akkermansia sp. N21169]
MKNSVKIIQWSKDERGIIDGVKIERDEESAGIPFSSITFSNELNNVFEINIPGISGVRRFIIPFPEGKEIMNAYIRYMDAKGKQ